MKLLDNTLWLTPTELGVHLECRHATALALANAHGRGPGKHTGGEYETLIREKGELHEQRYLERLRAAGRQIVEIPLGADFADLARITERAMRDGIEVIYQATFAEDGWRGRADFLERVPMATALGDWGYEAVDTKLARNEALPHHVLQLGVYSQWIERVQSVAPEWMHLELGSGRRESIRVREVAAYVRRARGILRQAVEEPQPTEPVPNAHCAVCGYRSHCEAQWDAEDHLNRVAGIGRGQITALRDAGIDTLTRLAGTDPSATVADVAPDTLAGLQWQARLQHQARRDGSLPYDRRGRAPERGFARLPRPDAGDVFLDLEGDPFWDPARELWFLFGIVLQQDGEWTYRALWGHDPAGEAHAFEQLIDLISARRVEHPGMHVYHYSPAEPSALRRLAAHPSDREAEVDDLLRAEVFVDLYAVIRQALVVGATGYGLKITEKLAGFTRSAETGSGADAVVEYERWRMNGEQALLDDIAHYNEEDCRATLVLRDWLIAERPPGTPWWPQEKPPETTYVVSPERLARFALRDQLVDGATAMSLPWFAGHLLDYHRREQRPGWWQWFERLTMSHDQLLVDREVIAGLTRTAREPWIEARSLAYELTYPGQEHKLHSGARVADPATGKAVPLKALDEDAGTLIITRGSGRAGEPLPQALVPTGPIDAKPIEAALLRLATAVRNGADGHRAVRDLLMGERPRISGRVPGASLQTLDPDEQVALARDLDHSTLVVQGPPGTGKTWLGGRLIAALIAGGASVGVSATSHKAIDNLLAEVEVAAAGTGLTFVGARKVGDGEATANSTANITCTTSNDDCEDPALQLVAGTAWLLSRERLDQTLDYVVIDEAGQMSLADAAAVGTSARNMILLGDPQQLPHVSQATHVEGTGVSVLAHVLGDRATIPADRGVFLTETRRMHPDVCDFISREIYDDRLTHHPDCARQDTGVGTGIRHLPVTHVGNSSSSREEAEAIAGEIAGLLGVDWTDQHGCTRPLTVANIMAVAPYNAQVRMLRSILPSGVRVGTVDKFQGQEAPVVFFSMGTSTGEDLPRDVGFLFSRNRLNVAISRARCLAYLVCSPALLDARAGDVEDMRLISTLCALVEEAERQAGNPAAQAFL